MKIQKSTLVLDDDIDLRDLIPASLCRVENV
jgi:hypothetical protein